jgi:2-polyprenyl-3-methyl-5-hydroxy-6-metoxy-1,4-benzoquinol methylase
MDKSSYTSFYGKCCEIEQRFGRQGKLPLRQLDFSIISGKSLLDFGAGKGLYSNLAKYYYTVDADATVNPTYATLGEARCDLHSVDAVIANQVFEHITPTEIDDALAHISDLLVKDGIIVATIPNIHRGSYFFDNMDHKTPLTYYHVGAFMEFNNIEVIDAYRYTKNPNLITNADEETKRLIELLEKLYELDPAQFIAVVGKKL